MEHLKAEHEKAVKRVRYFVAHFASFGEQLGILRRMKSTRV
jgi:hypothetical protein